MLIDEDGTNLGVRSISEALSLAEQKGLDLVEVAPNASPPVCRIMDYGKYKYQQQKREKEARKKQKSHTLKEIKMRPKIDVHDYNFKLKAIREFLEDGHKVKVTIFFRGREMAHTEIGQQLLLKVAEDCADVGKIESKPKLEGRFYRMMLAPKSNK